MFITKKVSASRRIELLAFKFMPPAVPAVVRTIGPFVVVLRPMLPLADKEAPPADATRLSAVLPLIKVVPPEEPTHILPADMLVEVVAASMSMLVLESKSKDAALRSRMPLLAFIVTFPLIELSVADVVPLPSHAPSAYICIAPLEDETISETGEAPIVLKFMLPVVVPRTRAVALIVNGPSGTFDIASLVSVALIKYAAVALPNALTPNPVEAPK